MLVSAIMPTRGRQALARTAVKCFMAQTYAPRELVILDDEDDPSFPGAFADRFCAGKQLSLRYLRQPRATIGAKREKCCQLAQGEVIMHFDSDDWSAPGRMEEQVRLLGESGKPMSGYHSLLFWDMRTALGYRWKGAEGFAIGTSMAYTKEFWKSHRWPEYSGLPANPRFDATDVQVMRQAQAIDGVATLDGGGMCVARAHDSNSSSARNIASNGWPRIRDEAFPSAFFAAVNVEALT